MILLRLLLIDCGNEAIDDILQMSILNGCEQGNFISQDGVIFWRNFT